MTWLTGWRASGRSDCWAHRTDAARPWGSLLPFLGTDCARYTSLLYSRTQAVGAEWALDVSQDSALAFVLDIWYKLAHSGVLDSLDDVPGKGR